MSPLKIESCLEAVESVFEREAEFIVAGNIVELGALSTSKLEHLTELSNAIESGALAHATPAIISRVKRLQATASEHSKHLEALRYGLQRVQARLGRMQSDTLVGSYNRYGSQVRFSDSVGAFCSKA